MRVHAVRGDTGDESWCCVIWQRGNWAFGGCFCVRRSGNVVDLQGGPEVLVLEIVHDLKGGC